MGGAGAIEIQEGGALALSLRPPLSPYKLQVADVFRLLSGFTRVDDKVGPMLLL